MKKLLPYLVGLIFLAAPIALFVFWLLPSILLWQKAQSWQEVDAYIQSTDLEVHRGDDSTTYKVTARYQYEFLGQTYTGRRVGISGGSDNIGSYHQDWHRELKSAQRSQRPITAWIDPDNPKESLLDREIRYGVLALQGVLIFVFGAVGVGILAAVWWSRKRYGELPEGDPARPWTMRREWASPTVYSSAKLAPKVMLWFALVWLAMSSPVLFILKEEILEKQNWLALLAIVFPVAGIWMLVVSLKWRHRWKKIGATPLQLDPYPGSVGGQIGGYIDVNSRLDQRDMRLTLACIKHYQSGSGKNRRTSQSVRWQRELVPMVEAAMSGSRVSFCFDVPEDLPESDADTSYPYYSWNVQMEGKLPDGTPLDREYEIPVFKTTMQSTIKAPEAQVGNAATQAVREQEVAEAMPFTTALDGTVHIHFPAGRNMGLVLFLMVFAVVFGGVGLFFTEPPMFMRIIFSSVGAIVLLIAIYQIGNSLKAQLAIEGVYSRRYLFGIPLGKKMVPSYSFSAFQAKRTSTSSTGSKHTEYFKIVAKGSNGEQATIAEGLKGRGQADVAIAKLKEVLPF